MGTNKFSAGCITILMHNRKGSTILYPSSDPLRSYQWNWIFNNHFKYVAFTTYTHAHIPTHTHGCLNYILTWKQRETIWMTPHIHACKVVDGFPSRRFLASKMVCLQFEERHEAFWIWSSMPRGIHKKLVVKVFGTGPRTSSAESIHTTIILVTMWKMWFLCCLARFAM